MASETRQLYALASGLGLVERGNKDDPFHQLVYGITGKEHVSELTPREIQAVKAELYDRMRLKNHALFMPTHLLYQVLCYTSETVVSAR